MESLRNYLIITPPKKKSISDLERVASFLRKEIHKLFGSAKSIGQGLLLYNALNLIKL